MLHNIRQKNATVHSDASENESRIVAAKILQVVTYAFMKKYHEVRDKNASDNIEEKLHSVTQYLEENQIIPKMLEKLDVTYDEKLHQNNVTTNVGAIKKFINYMEDGIKKGEVNYDWSFVQNDFQYLPRISNVDVMRRYSSSSSAAETASHVERLEMNRNECCIIL